MLAFTGMLLMAFIFVAYRFKRLKTIFWSWAIIGGMIWLFGYGLVQMISSFF